MRFRNLRIACSIFAGLACLLLAVLWVRSYYVGDVVMWSATKWNAFQFTSMEGELSARHCALDGAEHHGGMDFPDRLWQTTRVGMFGPAEHGFAFRRWFYIAFPYWALIVLFAVLAAVPWLFERVQRRYSLRTLLIAATLFALLLGFVVYAIG